MRGKVVSRHITGAVRRITPAHAGKRYGLCYGAAGVEDHPRACGEKGWRMMKRAVLKGSPPRMRGKAIVNDNGFDYLRITPAHAGKSALQVHRYITSGDHPRACGEKGSRVGRSRRRQGSPPRMRGKVPLIKAGEGGQGITPAHAGKSFPKA